VPPYLSAPKPTQTDGSNPQARLNNSSQHIPCILTSSAHRFHSPLAAVLVPTITVVSLALLLGSLLWIRRRRRALLESSINTVLSTEAPLVSTSGTSRPVWPGLTATDSRDSSGQWEPTQCLREVPPLTVDCPETRLHMAYAEIQPYEAVLQSPLSSAAVQAGDPYGGIVRERMLTPHGFTGNSARALTMRHSYSTPSGPLEQLLHKADDYITLSDKWRFQRVFVYFAAQESELKYNPVWDRLLTDCCNQSSVFLRPLRMCPSTNSASWEAMLAGCWIWVLFSLCFCTRCYAKSTSSSELEASSFQYT
jgi:hypothetical protein